MYGFDPNFPGVLYDPWAPRRDGATSSRTLFASHSFWPPVFWTLRRHWTVSWLRGRWLIACGTALSSECMARDGRHSGHVDTKRSTAGRSVRIDSLPNRLMHCRPATADGGGFREEGCPAAARFPLRYGMVTCAQKLIDTQLIPAHGLKNRRTGKIKPKTDMLRRNGIRQQCVLYRIQKPRPLEARLATLLTFLFLRPPSLTYRYDICL